jgi:predicted transcriptional regulator
LKSPRCHSIPVSSPLQLGSILPGTVGAGTLVPEKEGSAMATATAPIKVDAATDELVSHAAHFMSRSKKDIVDAAVREYIDAHRDEINAGIKAALGQLNGTDAAAVSLMTGLSGEELDDLGGMPK